MCFNGHDSQECVSIGTDRCVSTDACHESATAVCEFAWPEAVEVNGGEIGVQMNGGDVGGEMVSGEWGTTTQYSTERPHMLSLNNFNPPF